MKDVECDFDLLKKMFNTLKLIMCACIILHNMIIHKEIDNGYDENYHIITFIVAPPVI
jgi:hypothetical protein